MQQHFDLNREDLLGRQNLEVLLVLIDQQLQILKAHLCIFDACTGVHLNEDVVFGLEQVHQRVGVI